MERGKIKGRFKISSEPCSHCKCADFFLFFPLATPGDAPQGK